jgi:hypothetical protein
MLFEIADFGDLAVPMPTWAGSAGGATIDHYSATDNYVKLYHMNLQAGILMPLEIEPPIVQDRMTYEVANGIRGTSGRSARLDGQASCSPGDQLAQG